MSRFLVLPSRIMDDERIMSSGRHLQVMMALGNYADKKGWCHPSKKAISDKLNCHSNTAKRCLDDLVEWGYIERFERTRDDGGQSSNDYRILFDICIPETEETEDTPVPSVVPPRITDGTPPSQIPPVSGTPPVPKMADFGTPFNKEENNPLEQQKQKALSHGKKVTFPIWLNAIVESGQEALTTEDPIFKFAADVGIPIEVMHLGWLEFKRRYSEKDKAYIDWRAVFRTAIRENWLKLWYFDADEVCCLTVAGQQAQRAFAAERKAA